MPSRAQDFATPDPTLRSEPSDDGADEYPVREYIGTMAAELARMARWDGDEALAHVLEAATRLCEQPAPRPGPMMLEDAQRTGRT